MIKVKTEGGCIAGFHSFPAPMPCAAPDGQKALSCASETQIKRLIADRCPDQPELPFALWTHEAVGRLIERETSARLSSRSTIGGHLRNWPFTPQRPQTPRVSRAELAGSRLPRHPRMGESGGSQV